MKKFVQLVRRVWYCRVAETQKFGNSQPPYYFAIIQIKTNVFPVIFPKRNYFVLFEEISQFQRDTIWNNFCTYVCVNINISRFFLLLAVIQFEVNVCYLLFRSSNLFICQISRLGSFLASKVTSAESIFAFYREHFQKKSLNPYFFANA